MSPSCTQLTSLNTIWYLILGHLKTQMTQVGPTVRLWKLFKCVKRAFGRVRSTRTVRNAMAVTKKYRNFRSFLGATTKGRAAAEQCIQRKRRTKLRKKQTHRSFSGLPILPSVTSVFINEKRWKSKRRSINGFKQTTSTLQKPKKTGNHVRFLLPEQPRSQGVRCTTPNLPKDSLFATKWVKMVFYEGG